MALLECMGLPSCKYTVSGIISRGIKIFYSVCTKHIISSSTCTHTYMFYLWLILLLMVMSFPVFVWFLVLDHLETYKKNSQWGEGRLEGKLFSRHTWNPLERRKMIFPRLEFSPVKAPNVEITARKWGTYGSFCGFECFFQHRCLIDGIMVIIGKWNKVKVIKNLQPPFRKQV